jgi:hypothetical protein
MTTDTFLGIVSVALSIAMLIVDRRRRRILWYFTVALLILSTTAFASRQLGHTAKVRQLAQKIDESVGLVPRSAEDLYLPVSHETDWDTFTEALSQSVKVGNVKAEFDEFQATDRTLIRVRLYSH